MNIIELSSWTKYEICLLNLVNGNYLFTKGEKYINSFTGTYFREDDVFLALFPTKNGPTIYYEGKQFPLEKKLSINWEKHKNRRFFEINEYKIKIEYNAISYGIGWWEQDEWNNDLLCNIYIKYKTEEFYQRYTSDLEYDLSKEFNDLIKKQ